LFLFRFLFPAGGQNVRAEAGIEKADIPWLIGAVLAGGFAAPVVLMFSLRVTFAATASLLFNFETAATTFIAAFAFREAVGRRVWWAIILVTAASILLTLNTGGQWGISAGALGVLAACALWGIDNNFTRNISAKDPLAIVTIKGIGSGSFSLMLAVFLQNPLPGLTAILGAMVLGYFSYGLSIVLFIRAMRCLGAARTSATFATVPFIGVLLSLIILRETPGTLFFISLPFMVAGVALLLSEVHDHKHIHYTVEHEHRHCHNDEHHTHDHGDQEFPPNGFHSHPHKHECIDHSHPHNPGIHHRHAHKPEWGTT
jgi:drug/metabolite transporter (DMT)-like permease